MKSSPSRLPSPALVIACVALFASLGGVSYALTTGSVDSRELLNNTIRSKDVRNNTLRTFDIRNNEVRGFDIRNSSVQGRDVAFNTLTGADISEQSLGQVPSAATADSAASATRATTADSVGGVTLRRFNYAAEAGTGFVEVLNFGGLRLEARCVAPSSLEVQGTPADPNSEVSSSIGTPALVCWWTTRGRRHRPRRPERLGAHRPGARGRGSERRERHHKRLRLLRDRRGRLRPSAGRP